MRVFSYPLIYLGLALIVGASAAKPIASKNRTSTILPKPLATAVLQNLSSLTGLPQTKFKVAKVEPATWQDCLLDSSGVAPLEPCQAVSRAGWRATVAAKGQNWIYYVTTDGQITLDSPASLSSLVKDTLVQKLPIPNWEILAAEPTSEIDRCQSRNSCASGYRLGWRLLVRGQAQVYHLYHLSLTGQNLTQRSLKSFLPQKMAQLPPAAGDAVIRDVRDRLNFLPPNLRVESIKPITWSYCGGGPDRPSLRPVGACPVGSVSGWQMVVIGGPIRWVYYLEKNSVESADFIPTPDGLQSVPLEVRQAALADTAKRTGVSPSQLRVEWVEAKLFDRCLNVDNQKLNCRQGIQPGWEVLVLSGKVSNNSSLQTESHTYHVNLTGNNVRFVRQGFWAPPP
ncbi:MAG: hypothetical protein KME17_25505 [Cyanosarcina radialis HA8281-LM2]|nr:hypothetical protein [Cyanosarcina radialis HA8281-LM2]